MRGLQAVAANLEIVAAICAVLWIGVDIILRRVRAIAGYELNDSLCSVCIGAMYLLTWLSIRGFVLTVFLTVAHRTPFAHPNANSPLGWLLTYVGVDLGYYAYHRLMHATNAGWAAHAVHHSSSRFNYTTATRGSFVEPLFELLVFGGLQALFPGFRRQQF